MVPIIMLTGLVMTFGWPSPAVAWAVVLHFTAGGLVVSGLMIHVYMAAVFPEEKPAFFSMLTGSVHELYAMISLPLLNDVQAAGLTPMDPGAGRG